MRQSVLLLLLLLLLELKPETPKQKSPNPKPKNLTALREASELRKGAKARGSFETVWVPKGFLNPKLNP